MFFKITPALQSFFNIVAGLKAPTQVLSYENCEFFINTFFYRTPPGAASENFHEKHDNETQKNHATNINYVLKDNNDSSGTICKDCSNSTNRDIKAPCLTSLWSLCS